MINNMLCANVKFIGPLFSKLRGNKHEINIEECDISPFSIIFPYIFHIKNV